MNIADKPKLYAEMRRVLRPGGRLAIYDIMAGPGGPPHYPVPWAHEPAISHLAKPEDMRGYLAGAGFSIDLWRDTTDQSVEWLSRRHEEAAEVRAGGREPPLNTLALLFGELAPTLADNMARNVRERRILTIQIIGTAAG